MSFVEIKFKDIIFYGFTHSKDIVSREQKWEKESKIVIFHVNC